MSEWRSTWEGAWGRGLAGTDTPVLTRPDWSAMLLARAMEVLEYFIGMLGEHLVFELTAFANGIHGKLMALRLRWGDGTLNCSLALCHQDESTVYPANAVYPTKKICSQSAFHASPNHLYPFIHRDVRPGNLIPLPPDHITSERTSKYMIFKVHDVRPGNLIPLPPDHITGVLRKQYVPLDRVQPTQSTYPIELGLLENRTVSIPLVDNIVTVTNFFWIYIGVEERSLKDLGVNKPKIPRIPSHSACQFLPPANDFRPFGRSIFARSAAFTLLLNTTIFSSLSKSPNFGVFGLHDGGGRCNAIHFPYWKSYSEARHKGLTAHARNLPNQNYMRSLSHIFLTLYFRLVHEMLFYLVFVNSRQVSSLHCRGKI
ncbi:uncharacterized protein BDR25DRAFT_348736 [Lindgomyces ingoldianus]|uniref:Uncharacterized protein n=1 Tax=Lindgomyces ingoldianus TaxID=673940 RepID=A0ACB6REA2_9PLEO|nr:uncharacterized protein BDR25DRAFT_348736 [Lindgomyces ingoldianus]KAF2476811.1 hypothetical protein BDR25DRAFT_348736 [Lindgomyces ingoldianus]